MTDEDADCVMSVGVGGEVASFEALTNALRLELADGEPEVDCVNDGCDVNVAVKEGRMRLAVNSSVDGGGGIKSVIATTTGITSLSVELRGMRHGSLRNCEVVCGKYVEFIAARAATAQAAAEPSEDVTIEIFTNRTPCVDDAPLLHETRRRSARLRSVILHDAVFIGSLGEIETPM